MFLPRAAPSLAPLPVAPASARGSMIAGLGQPRPPPHGCGAQVARGAGAQLEIRGRSKARLLQLVRIEPPGRDPSPMIGGAVSGLEPGRIKAPALFPNACLPGCSFLVGKAAGVNISPGPANRMQERKMASQDMRKVAMKKLRSLVQVVTCRQQQSSAVDTKVLYIGEPPSNMRCNEEVPLSMCRVHFCCGRCND